MNGNRWKHMLNIADLWEESEKKGGTLNTSELGKQIAKRIKIKFASILDDKPENNMYDPHLAEIVDALENINGYDDVSPVEEFDDWWNGFYDWANANRVWVSTIRDSRY